MNRSAVASLAAVVAGAGLAWGQAESPPQSTPTTNGHSLPRTVFPVGQSPTTSPPPRPAEPPPKKPAAPPPAPKDQRPRQKPQPAAKPPAPVKRVQATEPAPAPQQTPVNPPVTKPEDSPREPAPMPKADPPSTRAVVPPPPAASEAIPAPKSLPADVPAAPPPIIIAPPANSGGGGYSTGLVRPPFPWLKTGRQFCGSVYMDTPYAWLNAEYFAAYIKPDHTVPLVTTAPITAANPGALDDPDTSILFDGQRLHDQPFWGGRFAAGTWYDECQFCGGEIGYFFLGSHDRGFISGGSGAPGLPGVYVPFFNASTGAQDAFAVARSNQRQGVVEITSRTRVQGPEAHFLFSFARGLTWRTDAILGVRWLILDEDITVEERIRAINDGAITGNTVGVFDQFGTRSDFIGADVGFKTQIVSGCWSFELLTRIAIGGNHLEISNIGETTTTTEGNLPVTTQGGFLIGPRNIGTFDNDRFSIVPEVGVKIAYQPLNWVKLSLGYNWLYWDNVVRPGGNIDRVIEFGPDPRRPGQPFNVTDFWVQSANVGLQFLY